MEMGMDREMTDEEMTDEGMISDEEIHEALKKSQPASEWIADFINSNNPKFKGKSKGERINMALGAYYAAQRNESVSEGVEEPRAQGEKNFKAAHTIVKMADPNADRQTGTEAMDQKAKPVLPIGKTFSKAEDIDGEKYIDKDFAGIKSSATRATAPKATGAAKLTYANGCDVYNKTAASIKKSAQGAASAPKATGSKQSGAQSAEKVSNTAPNGKLSAEYPKAKQKGSEAMPKGLKETALATLLGEDALEEGLFDTVKALGKNVAGAVASKVSASAVQAAQAQLAKAKQEGDAAEIARLQARIAMLQKNQPTAAAPAAATDAPIPGTYGTPEHLQKLEVGLKAAPPENRKEQLAFWTKALKTGVAGNGDPLSDTQKKVGAHIVQTINALDKKAPTNTAKPAGWKPDIKKFKATIADKSVTPDAKLLAWDLNGVGNPLFKAALEAEFKNRGLKIPAQGAKPAAVTGAASLAQKTAQSKLAKQSTKQLQATMARIQAQLKQRGVTEDVSFNEAFEFLGESLINEAMTNFDKQFADDNEKALKQILNNQGTDGIECHGQPKQKVLLQLNKFIDSYGDELKKYFSIPVQDKEVNEAAEMSDEDRDDKVSAIFKRFGIQDTNYEQDLDKAIEDLSKKSRIAAAQVKSLLKDSVNEEEGGSLASDKIENSVVVALTDLQEVLDRCLAFVPRTASYANPRISMVIQRIHQNLSDVCYQLENTNDAVKESAEVKTDRGDTTVPRNTLVDALKELAEVIEYCEGVVPRRADFKYTHLLMKVQKAHELLADVGEELTFSEG
jgi:hypothetical protein